MSRRVEEWTIVPLVEGDEAPADTVERKHTVEQQGARRLLRTVVDRTPKPVQAEPPRIEE